MASALCTAEECNRLVFEAVNEMSVSKFQSVISSFSQIRVLTSLAQLNNEGESPLVIAIKEKNVTLIDELLKFLKLCDREVHVSDAIEQLFHHQIPIVELIFHLTKHFPNSLYLHVNHSEWLDTITQAIFKSTSLSRPDKITALELIGASLRNCHGVDRLLMFRCWREAMTLRYFPSDGEPLLPKTPYVGVTSVASSVVFGTAEEVMSIEELDLLEEDFEREVVDLDVEVRLMCTIRMQRQSLLVIRRICCQVNHGHPHFFYLLFLYENGIGMMQDCQVYGVDNIVQHNIDNRIVINTFLLILEQMTGFDPKLLPRQSFNIFINALRVVSHLLAFMARIPPGYGGREELSYTNLLTATKFIGTIAKCFPNPAMMSAIEFHSQDYFEVGELISVMGEMMGSSLDDQYHGFAKIVYDLVFVLESMSPQLNNQEKQQIELHLSHYIRNYFLERSTSVLHAGVFGLMKFRSSANLKTIKLILRLGADPNAINENGQTPLHWLAEIIFVNSGEYMPVFQALVDAGVHLDIAEDDGETVLDILKEYLMLYKDEDVANYFSSQIHQVFPLSCYCARAIRRHGIQFDGDRIPLHLQPFVSRHSNR